MPANCEALDAEALKGATAQHEYLESKLNYRNIHGRELVNHILLKEKHVIAQIERPPSPATLEVLGIQKSRQQMIRAWILFVG